MKQLFKNVKTITDMVNIIIKVDKDFRTFYNISRSDVQEYIDMFESASDSTGSLRWAAKILRLMTSGKEELLGYLIASYGGEYAASWLIGKGYDALTSGIKGWKLMVTGVKAISNIGFNAASIFEAGYDLESVSIMAENMRNEFQAAYNNFRTDPVRYYKTLVAKKEAMIKMTEIEIEKYNAVTKALEDGPAEKRSSH